MQKIYTSPDRIMVFHCKNLLESHNIECVVKNEFLAGAAGEIPPNECWPELWVKNVQQYKDAMQILNSNCLITDKKLPIWKCTKCGEKLEGQFTTCWRCGENRYR